MQASSSCFSIISLTYRLEATGYSVERAALFHHQHGPGTLMGLWVEYPEWFKIVTYIGLGYVVTRHRGLSMSINVVALAALADNLLGWLALALHGQSYEGTPLWLLRQITVPEVMEVLVQTGILSFLG